MPVGAVVMAAGSATRMGRIKQLLPYRGTTLIQHAISQAEQTGFAPIIVVLGANAPEIQAVLKDASCEIVSNDDWATGMGSSLRAGASRLLELMPDVAGLAAMLADQPRVTASHLSGLLEIFEQGQWPVVAAEYNGSPGVPAIFGQQFFPSLLRVAPDAGARHLLRDAGSLLYRHPLPEAAIDVDTPEDYAGLT